MTSTIFYSWQSDIRAAACRTLIQGALEQAATGMVADGQLEVVPVIDRDTQNVPGSPDIGATILAKIDRATAFVADVTIVGETSPGRPTPNPNVLLELGYAIRALGDARIVLVQNTVFGVPEVLPFDLRQKRVLTYESAENRAERSPERRRLSGALQAALTPILKMPPGHESEDENSMARWIDLAEQARVRRIWVELDSPAEIDVGVVTASGRSSSVPALLAGPIMVSRVERSTLELGFPLRNQGGISMVTIPWSIVQDVWNGSEGRLHIMLKRGILFKNGTSIFVTI
jgi:hypothetical protein